MTKYNKTRIITVLALLVSLVLTASIFAVYTGSQEAVALAETVEPEGWEDWGGFDVQLVELKDLTGAGTESKPYEISTPNELAFLSKYVEDGGSTDNIVFKLTSNINMDGALFTPIGTSSNPFCGKFRGSKYIIKNLYILQSGSDDIYAGLFGCLGTNSVVSQLGIYGGIIKNTVSGSEGTGGVAGYAAGQMYELFSTANVYTTNGKNTGGLVGYSKAEISDVYTNCIVNGITAVGGIVGATGKSARLVDSLALGVTTGTSAVGGICGNGYFESQDSGFNAKFYYSYYNLDRNTADNFYAIGSLNEDESKAYSDTSTDTGATYLMGWTELQFHNSSVDKHHFSNKSRWVDKYESYDGSARYAIALANLSSDDNSDIAKNSLALRIYDYNGSVDGEWGASDQNPYIISTTTQLVYLASLVNQGTTYLNKHFKLGADLDFTDVEFAPIGVYGQATNRPFKGTFNGDNHTIDNLVIDRTAEQDGKENYIGIFGYADSQSTIKNLIIGSGCSIRGMRYIGSLAGKADGTVTQITTYASVVGSQDSGGLVGHSANGNFTNILSLANLSATAGSTGVLYGILGSASGLNAVTNCWYMVDYSALFRTTNSWGSVMIVDRNGSVTATKDTATGMITFEGLGDVGWNTEFRNGSEANISTSTNTYISDSTNTLSVVVYARFVKEVTCDVIENATVKLYDTNKELQDGEDSFSGKLVSSMKFYQGQQITMYIDVQDGYYVNSVKVTDMKKLKNIEASYTYSDSTGIKTTFAMSSGYSKVSADILAVNATPIAQRQYDGTATSYSMTIDGFDVTYAYSVGYAPKNAGSYKLAVIVRKDTIQRGKATLDFIIDTKQLTVDLADVNKVKEFDGDADFVETTVNQDGIDIIEGDDVIVKAYIRFDNSETPTNEQIGAGEGGDVRFALEGAAAANYEAPAQVRFNDGKITKRTITVEIEDTYLTQTYDGNSAAILHFGVTNQLSGKPAGVKLKFYVASDEEKTPVSAIDVNTYGIIVYSDDATSNDIYSFALKEDYAFSILPLAVAVNIKNTEDLVYDSTPISVGGQYYDEFSLKKTLLPSETAFKYYRLVGDDYVEDSLHTVAGSYKVEAVLSGNYIVDDTKTDADNAVNVAYYEVSKATSPELTIIVPTGNYKYGDAPITLSYSGGSSEASEITYEVVSGFGETAGDTLTFVGGGEIKVAVKKAASDNYLEGTSEAVTITVAKRTLDITLNDFSVTYLDDVEFPFEFSGFVQCDIDAGLTKPNGFDLPTVYVNGLKWKSGTYYNASTIPYNIVIDKNATSNGYEFNYINLDKSSPKRMTVNRKSVEVRADAKTAAYGDGERKLTYTVWDGDTKLDVTLNGELAKETGDNAGTYGILAGTITDETNTNYTITFVGADYTITPLTLEITMSSVSKTYGEPDPELQLSVSGYAYGERWDDAVVGGSITRRTGENAYTSTTDYGFYAYIGSTLKMSINYKLVFHTANLIIYPYVPEFEKEDLTYQITYGDKLSSITPTVNLDNGVSGIFEWKTPDVVPDFTNSKSLEFIATFIPSSNNFKSVVTNLTVEVIPREVGVVYLGDDELTYNGKEQKVMSYKLKNVLSGDDLHEKLIYEGEFAEVGTYTVRLEISNLSYTVAEGDEEIIVKIVPAPLTVYMEETAISEGDKPTIKFVYEGFVNGEDESVLTSLPQVDLGTMAGTYNVKPYGAEAANYKIIYKTTVFKIYRDGLTSDVQNMTIYGDFDYRSVLMFSETKKSENSDLFNSYSELIAASLESLGVTDKSELQRLFAIGVTVEGEKQSIVGNKISMEVPARLRESKVLRVAFIQEDGTINYADDVSVDGKVITFTAKEGDYIALICPPDYTWIVLAAVIVFLVIAAFVIDAVTEKLGVGRHSKKRKKKAEAQVQDVNQIDN